MQDSRENGESVEDFLEANGRYPDKVGLHAASAGTTGLRQLLCQLEVKNTMNTRQMELIDKALRTGAVTLGQGPPGTGKSTVAAEIVQGLVKTAKHFSEQKSICRLNSA